MPQSVLCMLHPRHTMLPSAMASSYVLDLVCGPLHTFWGSAVQGEAPRRTHNKEGCVLLHHLLCSHIVLQAVSLALSGVQV
jgi:hypothetical protein